MWVLTDNVTCQLKHRSVSKHRNTVHDTTACHVTSVESCVSCHTSVSLGIKCMRTESGQVQVFINWKLIPCCCKLGYCVPVATIRRQKSWWVKHHLSLIKILWLCFPKLNDEVGSGCDQYHLCDMLLLYVCHAIILMWLTSWRHMHRRTCHVVFSQKS